MDKTDSYRTIAGKSEGIYKEKGSKFIAYAYPLLCEGDVKDILNDLRKEHYAARHHCYAYILFDSIGEKYRINDDGEPSGTAGKPIYNQINKFKLKNVLVVVVRYFGGILLGTGGLTKAYRNATEVALNNSTQIDKFIEQFFEINFPYVATSEVMNVLNCYNVSIVSQSYRDICKFNLRVRNSDFETACNKLININNLKLIKFD